MFHLSKPKRCSDKPSHRYLFVEDTTKRSFRWFFSNLGFLCIIDAWREQLFFLAKARESLASAESEFLNSRFNNCTNRCYYACLQAARAALEKAGLKPTEPRLPLAIALSKLILSES